MIVIDSTFYFHTNQAPEENHILWSRLPVIEAGVTALGDESFVLPVRVLIDCGSDVCLLSPNTQQIIEENSQTMFPITREYIPDYRISRNGYSHDYEKTKSLKIIFGDRFEY